MPDPNAEQWEEVHPRGGKSLDVRVVAHTTIYHEASNSLIVRILLILDIDCIEYIDYGLFSTGLWRRRCECGTLFKIIRSNVCVSFGRFALD